MADFESEKKEGQDDRSNGSGILFLLSIIFLPATIIGVLIYYIMLRKFHQRPKTVLIFSSFLSFIAIIYLIMSDALTNFIDVFLDITNIFATWPDIIPFYMAVNVIIGSIAGFVVVSLVVQQMKVSEYRTKLPGSWMYQFEYYRSPWQILRRKQIIKGLKDGKFSDGERTALGLEEGNADKDFIAYRYLSEAVKPTLINGAAGSGKTITETTMINNDIKVKTPVFIIDFKRSPELAAKVAKFAHDNDSEFYHFVNGEPENYDIPYSKGQSSYNPFKNAGASKPDMILGMREYDIAANVYKNAMREILQVFTAMLTYSDPKKTPNIDRTKGDIYEMVSALKPGVFTELASACEGTPIEEAAIEIDLEIRKKTSTKSKAFEELTGQLRTMTSSAYGKWLKTDSTTRNIDLYELSNTPGSVVLFSINSDSEKDFAQFFGSLILADLMAVSAKRRNNGATNQVNVYVDEFQAVSPVALTGLLEKSRESKIGMTISSQSLEQIISASPNNGEAYLGSILDTCSNFIIHAGSTEGSAKRFAEIIGTHEVTVYKQSNQSASFFLSFNWNNRRQHQVQTSTEERWKRSPSDFMSLSMPNQLNGYKSSAIVINKSPEDPRFLSVKGVTSRIVHMIPPQEVLDKTYVPSMADDEEPQYISSNDSHTDDEIAPLLKNPHDLLIPSQTFTEDNQEELDNSDDGGFVLEKIDDDQDMPDIDVDLLLSSNSFSKPEPAVSQKPKRSLQDDSIFDQMYKDSKKVRPEPKPTPSIKPAVNKKVSVSEEVEEEALPDLEDLF